MGRILLIAAVVVIGLLALGWVLSLIAFLVRTVFVLALVVLVAGLAFAAVNGRPKGPRGRG